MCGLAGTFFGSLGSDAVSHALARLYERGPDAHGEWQDASCHLLHRRLSVVDLDARSNQPMVHRQTGCVLAYNGELYNHHDLRAELSKCGQRFRTTSDTEVVLVALAVWGSSALSKFNGMFALAFWDPRTQTGLLARDRLGIKPLYFRHPTSSDGSLSFASEPAILSELERSKPVLNSEWLAQYLHFGTGIDGLTPYQGIEALPPATWLSINRSGIEADRYWRPVSSPTTTPELHLADVVDDAVGAQMVSDVPLGIFLSGGIDSSLIASSAARKVSGIRTFHVDLGLDPERNESKVAAEVASRLGTRHTNIELEPSDIAAMLFRLNARHGHPFGDSANIALACASKSISSELTVVLQGDGGDELFGGYRRYFAANQYDSLRSMVPSTLARIAGRLTPWFAPRIKRTLEAMSANSQAELLPLLMSDRPSRPQGASALCAPWRSDIDHSVAFSRYTELAKSAQPSDDSAAARFMALDLAAVLPSQFLEKVDRATMLSSVEARVPLLDNSVLDFALSTPTSQRRDKATLRALLADRIGSDIAYLPKRGFGVPIKRWMLGDLADLYKDLTSSSSVLRHGLLDPSGAMALYGSLVSNHKDTGIAAYRILSLMVWLDSLPTSLTFDFDGGS